MKDKLKLFFILLILLANFAACSESLPDKKMVSVTVQYDGTTPADTLMLFVANPLYPSFPSLKNPGTKIRATMNSDGVYKFKFKADHEIGYYLIANLNPKKGRLYTEERFVKRRREVQSLVPLLIYETGDKVQIRISPKKVLPTYETYDPLRLFDFSYSGPGANKLEVLTQTHDIYQKIGVSGPSFDTNQKYRDGYAKCAKAIRAYIEDQKDKISPVAYELIMTDALYSLYLPQFKSILKYYKEVEGHLSPEELENIKNAYFNNIKDALPGINLSKTALTQSYYYYRYLIEKNRTDCYFIDHKEDPSLVFERMMSRYSGELRERMLTLFLYTSFGTLQFNDQLERAVKITNTDYCKDMLTELAKRKSSKKIGNFTLEDPAGNPVPLSKFKGKVIVMDFWFTGCGGCKWVYQNVLKKAEAAYYNNPEVVFLSISVDGPRSIWENSLKEEIYTSDMAVNLYTSGQGMNHPIISDFKIRGYPTIIIVNQEGKIDSYDLAEFKGGDGYAAISDRIDKLLTGIQ
ncbi:TlpA family protein disulfide reductase [Sinomicrobium weinanense]|uniref:TlpA family protein disulfide reductase n=1 Tax=Sinomicrobium weinanense TaxID=2842200 RepID=A0A926JR14_9FLAO|nr:TlpA disulfide reductase family protein [Sinomicrobium weinanense]MBC9795868.1 TlpA family protein disulfide reductase [Sinomicrobium weinanense]MBU3125388.1 TlpA family protein disulfide reductase [Sinomicrobium weinanense]